MLRIGVTGRVNLGPEARAHVRDGMRAAIQRLAAGHHGRLRGISCLAPGADTIFAQVMLELDLEFEAVIPARDYRETLTPERAVDFDRLVAAASTVDYMEHSRSGSLAYRSANAEMLRRCAHLIAVLESDAPVKPGGTAEVVQLARASGIPVEIIDPLRHPPAPPSN